jgi:hypothetical protein
VPRGPALPFAAPGAKPPPPPGAKLPPPPAALNATAEGIFVPRGPALPFSAPEPIGPLGPARPPAAALPHGKPAPGALDETSLDLKIPRAFVLPFEKASSEPQPRKEAQPEKRGAPPAFEPSLGLEQHASLTLELVLHPERADDTRRRYRVTESEQSRMDAHYKRRFAADPALHARWLDAYRAYHSWLSAQSKR